MGQCPGHSELRAPPLTVLPEESFTSVAWWHSVPMSLRLLGQFHSCIHPLTQGVFIECFVPGPLLGTEDIIVNKTEKVTDLLELTC